MSYTKRADIASPAGWIAVEFEDGTFARVRCDKKIVDGGVCYHARAQAVDETGAELSDPTGQSICTEFKHVAPVSQVESVGDSTITLEHLLLVMGEETTLFPNKDAIKNGTTTNIRARMAAASVAGAANAGAVL